MGNERAEKAFGSNDIETLFSGGPLAVTPWRQANGRKDVKDYDTEAVHNAIRSEQPTEPVDPRGLSSTQPSITRDGVSHYMNSREVYKDAHQAGNRRPVVYDRNGTRMILSGHHRAAASLLRGEQFDAVVVRGGWGPPR